MKLPPNRYALAVAVRDEVADLSPETQALVACSGGPDSLALALAAVDAEVRARAVVVDHGLQPGSRAIADAAAEQCRELGLSTDVVTAHVARSGTGPEAAARAARYAALDRAAAESISPVILLGHTADDQSESVLLGLVRGSGVRSLAGIPRRRGHYRRPFLSMTRATVEASLVEAGITAWQDPHNQDPAYLRSRIRTEVLPFLAEQLGPGVAAGLRRTGVLARADADLLDSWADREFAAVREAGLPVAQLGDFPDAIRWRVLRKILIQAGCPGSDLTMEHVMSVDALITDWHGQGPLMLPGSVVVRRMYGTLEAEPVASE